MQLHFIVLVAAAAPLLSFAAEDCEELRASEGEVQRQIELTKSDPVQAVRTGIDEYRTTCGKTDCRALDTVAVSRVLRALEPGAVSL